MFWLHEENLPAGVGNDPFCPMHLIYLAVFFLGSVLYAVFYKKLGAGRAGKNEARLRADRILGFFIFFFGLCEYGITALVGWFTKYTLPLHVCSLMYILVPLHALTGGAKPGSFGEKLHAFLGAAVFHPGILGAWAALIFPDWLYYPFWNYLSISGFMGHGLISLYGAALLITISEAWDPVKLALRDLKNSVLFLSAGAVLMYFFDRATGTDYWFMLGPSISSPFLGAYEKGGYGGYLFAFLGTVAAVTALVYGIRLILALQHCRAAGHDPAG